MRTSREKYALLEEQIIGKVHWGAEDREVLTFLSEKHGIAGAEADRMLKMAKAARAAAIRNRALWEIIAASPIFVLCGGAIALGWGGGYIYAGAGISAVWIIQATWRLLTGRTIGPVDNP